MTESREIMIKRLRMRSMRRGIKEMDLILANFAEGALEAMDGQEIALYEAFLAENDHDLYQWVTGQADCPVHYQALTTKIAQTAVGVVRPD